MTDLLTTKQVQELLRVDRTTIYRMVESGQLPAMRVGKQWRFARAEVEHWLQGGRSTLPLDESATLAPVSSGEVAPEANGGGTGDADLAALLPLECAQLIQDAFAEMLGVMMVITDMQGRQITRVSNPCGFFARLTDNNPTAVSQCIVTWQQLAGAPSLEPRFTLSEMGLLCARGLIRQGTELKGMVVMGGIAPDHWPPAKGDLIAMADLFEVPPAAVASHTDEVFHLDRRAQERALRYIQRIADIYSHMLEDRLRLASRLKAVAAAAGGGGRISLA